MGTEHEACRLDARMTPDSPKQSMLCAIRACVRPRGSRCLLRNAYAILAVFILAVLRADVAGAQLMSTCTEDSPERRGELGCSIVETKSLPADLKEPVFWHIDRFDSRVGSGNCGRLIPEILAKSTS